MESHFLSGMTKTQTIVSLDWVEDLPYSVGRFIETMPCLAGSKRALFLFYGSNPLNQYLFPSLSVDRQGQLN